MRIVRYLTHYTLNVGSDDVFMDVPITKDILRLTSYVCDVLSQPGKNLLLCGINGSGRKESMHIGCTFLQIKIFSPIPVKNYKIEDFYNDLRMVAFVNYKILYSNSKRWLEHSFLQIIFLTFIATKLLKRFSKTTTSPTLIDRVRELKSKNLISSNRGNSL